MMEMELTADQKSQVADIMRRDLAEGFGDKWKFDPITVSVRIDHYGDPYCYIRVVCDGDGGFLDPRWINGFYRRNHAALKECGVPNIPVDTYVDATEEREYLEWLRANPDTPIE